MSDDRDFLGYGADPPDPKWPGGARIAVNINLNFEGGGERSIMEGDTESEGALNDIGQPRAAGARKARSSNRSSSTASRWASGLGGCLRPFRQFRGCKVCSVGGSRRRPSATPPDLPLSRTGTRSSWATAIAGFRLPVRTPPDEEREHVRSASRHWSCCGRGAPGSAG